MGGSAPCPLCGWRVIGGSGVFWSCGAEGFGTPKVWPNPGGVAGRSLGRCNTAAFICVGSFAAFAEFAVLVLFVLLFVELLADCP